MAKDKKGKKGKKGSKEEIVVGTIENPIKIDGTGREALKAIIAHANESSPGDYYFEAPFGIFVSRKSGVRNTLLMDDKRLSRAKLKDLFDGNEIPEGQTVETKAPERYLIPDSTLESFYKVKAVMAFLKAKGGKKKELKVLKKMFISKKATGAEIINNMESVNGSPNKELAFKLFESLNQ